MSITPHFPWQQTLWVQLIKAYDQNRLPHAFLLTDPEGFGQSQFAKALAQYFICHGQSEEQGHLFEIGNHPDFFHIKPVEDSTTITIDSIRVLKNNLLQSSHAGTRVIILEPAHALNNAASNALLKLLEEPSPNIFFILISSEPTQLAKTLLSRCQKFRFNNLDTTVSLNWLIAQNLKPAFATYFLKLAEGSPLQALTLSEVDSQQFRKEFLMDLHRLISHEISSVSLAEKWTKKQTLSILLEWMCRWLLDWIRLSQQALNEKEIPAPYLAILKQWQGYLNLELAFQVVDKIYEIRRIAIEIKGLNALNSLEAILSHFD